MLNSTALEFAGKMGETLCLYAKRRVLGTRLDGVSFGTGTLGFGMGAAFDTI